MMLSSVIIFDGNFGFLKLRNFAAFVILPRQFGSIVRLTWVFQCLEGLMSGYVCWFFLGSCCKYGWDGGLLIWHSSALRCWKVSRSLFPGKSIFPSAVHCHAKQSVGFSVNCSVIKTIDTWFIVCFYSILI